MLHFIYIKQCQCKLAGSSVSVKRGLRVFYPQNLGQDAQKNEGCASKDAHNFLYDAQS